MPVTVSSPIARIRRAICFSLFAGALSGTGLSFAQGSDSVSVSPPAAGAVGVASVAPQVVNAPAGTVPQKVTKPNPTPAKPLWASLTPDQQSALSPLANEWNGLNSASKTKWLKIANSFPKMQPEEQARLQNRMREWTKLTPEQRRLARESYARAKKLDPNEKSAQWQQYQQLPEDQKKKLAAEAAAKKRVTTLTPPSEAASKLAPPPKSALKSGLGNTSKAPVAASAVKPALPARAEPVPASAKAAATQPAVAPAAPPADAIK